MAEGTILVTGASTGIGEACALRFDRNRWDVFAGVRQEEDGKRLEEQSSWRLRAVHLDVTDPTSIDAAVEQIADAAGDAGLTAIVNNAGVGVGGPVEYLALEEWRRQLDVNVIGQVAVTKAVLPLIRQAGSRGRIVFMGSIGGRVASPFLGPYAASKHAIEAIAEAMRHELAGTGMRTVVVEPGAVRTPIWDKARSTADEVEAGLSAEGRQRYGPAIAEMRKGIAFQARTGLEPDAVARVVEKAVTSRRPSARYTVGRDAKVVAAAERLLPDPARDAFMRFMMKMATR